MKNQRTRRIDDHPDYMTRRTWGQIDHEDKVAIVGGGRAGYEARMKYGYGAGERIRD